VRQTFLLISVLWQKPTVETFGAKFQTIKHLAAVLDRKILHDISASAEKKERLIEGYIKQLNDSRQ
jgi:hypothetical protein